MTKKILIILYFIFWVSSIIVFHFFTKSSEAAVAYSIVVFWILLPIITFIVSFLIGKNDYWGKGKWFSAIVLGVLYMLMPYATFSASYMISSKKAESLDFFMMLYGVVSSLIGLVIGVGIRRYRLKKRMI